MRIIIAAVVCLLASSLNASGIFDIMESLAERAAEASVSSEVEVVELFHAETPEELEAALTDGYPMPWLEEILSDETIPEEDRYWLDCRVRAVIAQDLHLFYGRDGNSIHVQADWIRYGESYWQEHFIVNPLGEQQRGEINPITGLWGETGFVYNQYGEQTGELALCEEWMFLSRDGTIGLLLHRGSEHVTEYGPVYLYFVYNDGTYHKNPDGLWNYGYTLSQSGNYALLVQQAQNEPDPIQMFDRDGNIIWEQQATAKTMSACLSISPNDGLCCVPSNDRDPITHYVQVFNVISGYEVELYQEQGVASTFTPNGEYLCIGAGLCISTNELTNTHFIQMPERDLSATYLSFNNNADRYAAMVHPSGRFAPEEAKFAVWSEREGFILEQSFEHEEVILLSPNGNIVLVLPATGYKWVSPTPCNIWLIGGE